MPIHSDNPGSTDGSTSKTAAFSPAAIAGWIGGFALSKFLGMMVLIPLFGGGVCWYAGRRFWPEMDRSLWAAVSTQVGHILWFGVAIAMLSSDATLIAEVVGYTVLVALVVIFKRPGTVYALLAYQAFATAINFYSLISTEFGTVPNKALLVHLIVRSLAIFFMVKFLVEVRKTPSPPSEALAPNS